MIKDMFLEFQSKFEFDVTISTLIEKIEKANWKVQITHDLQQSLRNKGYEVPAVKIIELCNPDISHIILRRDDERIYSNLMPCRISVYKKSDGITYLSLMNAGVMASQLGGVVEEAMSKAFEESMVFVKEVTE